MDSTLHRPAAPLVLAGQQEASLPPGTVLAQRFTLMAHAGRGGMGSVYRATDSLSGRQVALKLLHATHSEALQRFAREASVLAQLRHPSIVSYVAHGVTDNGSPFLAMEWLDGEDLAQRLSRQPLSLQESLSLLRMAAQALALAHQHGVIHRDLKPSNLFLRHGRPEEVVLLDFGLARHVIPSAALTATQLVLGTPGYMAPEQASSQSALTPSADIFSLGCVLYECLTGKPPFSAPHFVAALAKILFTEPEPLRSLRPELPPALEELLERMLAKAPERRFPEASSLLSALTSLEAHLEQQPSPPAPANAPVLRLTGAEQHLVCVLLAAPLAPAPPPSGSQDSQRSLHQALRTLLSPHGAQVELLADGSLVATLVASHGSATDPAALAARCALLLQERWPQAAVVLTTGRGRLDQHLPVGEAMDRAGQLLRQLPPPLPDSTVPVLLDDVTAGLLGSGFQLTRTPSGVLLLHGEHVGADASRPLLGKPTPCVGREQELALLEMAFTTCVQESTAQALLVTAPAGTGKSRLRHEFLRRLENHGHPVQLLFGRGDPMSTGSANGLLAQALRRLCEIPEHAPLEVRRAQLSQRLARHLPPAQLQDVAIFLGELCGIPSADERNPRLLVARGDPRLMSTQIGRALVALLRAECAHHPVLLVLEDLHWGDALSVDLMNEALQELAEHPFMVLALARPEVEQLLSGAKLKRLQPLPLRGLSRKAGARLVSEVLGTTIPTSLIDQLVEQAAGNALFLEELIRGVAEGRGGAAPQTVLAMLQARIGRLEPEARQVLLAASFLGRTFWFSGVQALLGQEFTEPALHHWLQRLVDLEWVGAQPSSRFPAHAEYRFRHALVRDAAYELVPESHKTLGHQLAGLWLEQAGESDPQVLAEHARLGQQPQRAIPFYLRAAEQLFERYDMPSTMRCVEAALALGAQGVELLRARALQATAALWLGDAARLFAVGPELLEKLTPGSLQWCWMASGLHIGHLLGGNMEPAARLGRLLVSTHPRPEARLPYLEALAIATTTATVSGARPEAAAFLARMFELSAGSSTETSLERTMSAATQAWFSFYFEGQLWQPYASLEQTSRELLDVGLENVAQTAMFLRALAAEALGDSARAEVLFRESLTLAQRVALPLSSVSAGLYLAQFLASSPEPAHREEALALTNDWEIDLITFEGMRSTLRAKVMMARGQLSEAERLARSACEDLTTFFFYQLMSRVVLSKILLAQGRAAEAREVVVPGVQGLEARGSTGFLAVSVYLALAEACLAQGDTQEGEAALRKALQCVRIRARDIPDEAARERFLRQVPENARTLELAHQRWGEGHG
jgi:serine/threonine protein kinase/tetratricopeptide (TPR) repeat protein